MTGTTRTSADLDPRRRRILFRSWHRGIREMDLILGQFADENIATMSPEELDVYEALLEIDDRHLVQWVTGEAPTPERFDTGLFRRIRGYKRDTSRC